MGNWDYSLQFPHYVEFPDMADGVVPYSRYHRFFWEVDDWLQTEPNTKGDYWMTVRNGEDERSHHFDNKVTVVGVWLSDAATALLCKIQFS